MRKFYWVSPMGSNKYHIAEDGMTLCNNWMMTDTQSPVKDKAVDPVKGEDCLACVKRYNKIQEGVA